jgi:hypothetical protein
MKELVALGRAEADPHADRGGRQVPDVDAGPTVPWPGASAGMASWWAASSK